MDEHQKRFVKLVEQLSYSRSTVFRDFCEMAAISLANAVILQDDPEWQSREGRYLEIVKQYKPDELKTLAEMLGCVVNSLSTETGDFNFHDCLGELHMSDEITGRSKYDSDVAFTPKEVARLMAKMNLTGFEMPEKGYFRLGEPAAGSGGLVIQMCAEMKELGFNFQQQVHVHAVEIRSMIAHMAYIQFSLLHIPALVVHGDSLALTEWSVWKTPAHVLGLWDARLQRDFVAPEPQIVQVVKGQAAFDFQLRRDNDGTGNADSRNGKEHRKGTAGNRVSHRRAKQTTRERRSSAIRNSLERTSSRTDGRAGTDSSNQP